MCGGVPDDEQAKIIGDNTTHMYLQPVEGLVRIREQRQFFVV